MASNDLREELGNMIRVRRMAIGLTQAQLATRAGLGAKYVSEIERGTRDVPLSTLRAIVHDGLGLELDVRFDQGAKIRLAERALPRPVDDVARALAALPASERRQALAIVRATVRLAQR
ncbi:MAG: helix-turn-helix transcriptional regulator [Kofleriaceae bacterium]